MNSIDLPSWVESEVNPQRKIFRQSVHLVLRSIAQSKKLSPLMVMKGGILLAIRYNSPRFTTDIDFSTSRKIQDVAIPALLADIQSALAPVSADNEYGLALSVQSHVVKPPIRPNVSFPTLTIRIAFAKRSDRNQMARLQAKQAANTLEIDYSFNEWANSTEQQDIDGGALSIYAYHDLIAEKIRSVLQQPIRKRHRLQDIYDLCLLLEGATFSLDEKSIILQKLYAASDDRKVVLTREAMRNPEVINMSAAGYAEALPALIDSDPPAFEDSYKTVTDFFESLPWSNA